MLGAAVLAATACTSGQDDGLTAVPSEALLRGISLSVKGATVQSVALPPTPFPEDVKASVTATLDRYLEEAVLRPLGAGLAAGDLAPVFTGRTRARVEGPDRAALVDEAVRPADSLKADAATVALSALAGPDKAVVVVTADLDLRLRTGGDGGVTMARTGHLVLVPDGGLWKIDGYDVRTTREGAGEATTTTARR